MSAATLLTGYGTHQQPPGKETTWRWLPAAAFASLVHVGIWLGYTAWQSGQAITLPHPSVQISLISAPQSREDGPTPRPQRPISPPPKPAAAETPAPPDTTNAASEAPAATAASSEVASPAPPEETTPPLFQAAYLNNPPPLYPLAARRRGIEGTVVIRAQIMEDGSCSQASLSKSSGNEMLDQAALAAVKSWRFIPAKRGAQTFSAWVEVPITFRLSRQNEPT